MEYHGLVGHIRLVMLQCKVCELSGTESLKCFSCHQLIILHRTAVTVLNLCVGGREVGCEGGLYGGGVCRDGIVEVKCVGVGCTCGGGMCRGG